ncbi:ubiquitin-conjugating enzyme E2 U-like [Diadema antillarum]|uniref:ubiquitin-conjugating enzyme E2 U-like n=1 Tax=Diadema antillarum TaxID=105358 RepID=UPI003A878E6D
MHSRAYLLLDREYVSLQKDPAWGITAHPLAEDNMMEWTSTIRGMKDTIWEGGIFVLSLKFTENYNHEPPDIRFHTIPFHPNIDMQSGRPCIEFLDDISCWKETYSLQSILLAIQSMLSNPVIDDAVNEEAVGILENSPDLYRQMVIDCVNASRKVFAGQSIPSDESRVRFQSDKEDPADDDPQGGSALNFLKLAKISFDDYLTTWTGIATSKARSEMKNPLLEAISDDPKLQTAHYGLNVEELQQHMKQQLDTHNSLMYGKFGPKQSKEPQDKESKRLEHINKMRKIYLPRRSVPPPSTAPSEADAWEKEVDDLVAWTNDLDEDELK